MALLEGNHIRTVDGDTIWVAVKLRLSNCNAPELSERGGQPARLRLRQWMRTNDDLEIQITGGVDSFGRLLGIAKSKTTGETYQI